MHENLDGKTMAEMLELISAKDLVKIMDVLDDALDAEITPEGVKRANLMRNHFSQMGIPDSLPELSKLKLSKLKEKMENITSLSEEELNVISDEVLSIFLSK